MTVKCSSLLLCCLILCGSEAAKPLRNETKKISKEFMFGAATSSYQIEGAWDADGKSENIWDRLLHTQPWIIKDLSNGDIADDSYHLYKRDVQMMRELGLDHYRFSLSWTRILPTSFPDRINKAGVDFYNNLIDEMLKYNIEPMVTLYHWDLPQKLQDLGGWMNPYIVDWFADYALVVFSLFGDRVKYWITVNEPNPLCSIHTNVYLRTSKESSKGVADYMCAKNVLLAHAKAYHIYDTEFRATQGGVIGITLDAHWYEPASDENVAAAEETNLFYWGLYANPIFSEKGDFPKVMKDRIAAKSAEQGFPRSRLPELTAEEVRYIRGSSDFFGLNHYKTFLVVRNASVAGMYKSPSREDDVGVITYQPEEWNSDGTAKGVSWGFYKLLMQIKEYYNNPTVFVTENGLGNDGRLADDDRVYYYRHYLDAMLDAIHDGANVKMYTAWSLMDNFEWLDGYTKRFGLYAVDFKSSARTRTPRKSAFVYKHILSTRTLDFNYEPNSTKMAIE